MATDRAELRDRDDYDSCSDDEQALVRAAWDEQIARRLATLDLQPELQATGVPWAEADSAGTLIVRSPVVDPLP